MGIKRGLAAGIKRGLEQGLAKDRQRVADLLDAPYDAQTGTVDSVPQPGGVSKAAGEDAAVVKSIAWETGEDLRR